jgi:hypothetical protein
MTFSTALFYPWIDITDEVWLKTAMLYWDRIQTIVPQSIQEPYASPTAKEFFEQGALVPLRVSSEMPELQGLAEEMLRYLDRKEATELVLEANERNYVYIHADKLPYELRRIAFSSRRFRRESARILPTDLMDGASEEQFLMMESDLARHYITVLATRLSERIGSSLLTAFPAADNLAVSAKLDAPVAGTLTRGISEAEYTVYGPRRDEPRELVKGMLVQLILDKIKILPETPVEEIMKFRREHIDELGRFRKAIEDLTSSVESDLPMEGMKQRVQDIYANEFEPAYNVLKASLAGSRIKWGTEAFMKVARLSVPTTSILLFMGLSVPYALLAGAGLSLVAEGVLYNSTRREIITSNPYSYVLSAKKTFGEWRYQR